MFEYSSGDPINLLRPVNITLKPPLKISSYLLFDFLVANSFSKTVIMVYF